MMRFVYILLTWLYLTGFTLFSTAAPNHICSQKEAQEAESVVAIVKSWETTHRQFQHYLHCDDGAIAEGFSEVISILLAKHWDGISQLGEIIKFDPSFDKFVIRHIDETVPVERLIQIANNASKQCPRNLKKFCRDIQVACEANSDSTSK
ncbi:MAG: hypothetical protein ACXWE9_05865 [Methylobacter sp.]